MSKACGPPHPHPISAEVALSRLPKAPARCTWRSDHWATRRHCNQPWCQQALGDQARWGAELDKMRVGQEAIKSRGSPGTPRNTDNKQGRQASTLPLASLGLKSKRNLSTPRKNVRICNADHSTKRQLFALCVDPPPMRQLKTQAGFSLFHVNRWQNISMAVGLGRGLCCEEGPTNPVPPVSPTTVQRLRMCVPLRTAGSGLLRPCARRGSRQAPSCCKQHPGD